MTKKQLKYILILLFALAIITWPLIQKQFAKPTVSTPQTTTNETQQSTSTSNAQVLSAQIGKRTKTFDCVINGDLQDISCTPGDIFIDATVDKICVPGYSKSVRNVPVSVKNEVFAEYGIVSPSPGEYEVDHLISLELGGSNDIANLWPEAAEPRPGFHEKDKVENYLHSQVCNGSMKLEDAQKIIATDWAQVLSSVNK